jgi:hypothetical protein
VHEAVARILTEKVEPTSADQRKPLVDWRDDVPGWANAGYIDGSPRVHVFIHAGGPPTSPHRYLGRSLSTSQRSTPWV